MEEKLKRNRTRELLKKEQCRINSEVPLYMREALKAQAKSEDLHLHQVLKRYLREGLRRDGWDI